MRRWTVNLYIFFPVMYMEGRKRYFYNEDERISQRAGIQESRSDDPGREEHRALGEQTRRRKEERRE